MCVGTDQGLKCFCLKHLKIGKGLSVYFVWVRVFVFVFKALSIKVNFFRKRIFLIGKFFTLMIFNSGDTEDAKSFVRLCFL